MVEIWKDIPSYEGKYQASNFGNIKSLNFHRENNKLENLEYTTIKENVRYSQAFKVIGENIENGKKIYFNSTREVNKFGFSQRCVCRALNGEQKQTKGYKFYYLK